MKVSSQIMQNTNVIMREEKESQIGRESKTPIVARQRCHDFSTGLSPSKRKAKESEFGTFTREHKADVLRQPDGCYVRTLCLGNNELRNGGMSVQYS